MIFKGPFQPKPFHDSMLCDLDVKDRCTHYFSISQCTQKAESNYQFFSLESLFFQNNWLVNATFCKDCKEKVNNTS